MQKKMESATSASICLDSPALQAIRLPDQEHWVREQNGTSTEGDGASGADVKTQRGQEKKVTNRAARRNKQRPLFHEAPVQRRVAVEMEDANHRGMHAKESIMEMESYPQLNERTWVRLDEPERALIRSGDKFCIATVAAHALDEGTRPKFIFFVNKELLRQRSCPRCALCRTGKE